MSDGMRLLMQKYYGEHAPKEQGAKEALMGVRKAFLELRQMLDEYMDLVPAPSAEKPELAQALAKQRVTTLDGMEALATAVELLDLTFRDTLMGMEEIADTAAQAVIHRAAQTAPPSIQRLHRMQKEAETAIILDKPEENPTGDVTMRRGPVLFS